MVVVLILEADGKRLISIVSDQLLLKATITTHANSSALQMFVSQYLKADSLVLGANVHLAVELMSGADQPTDLLRLENSLFAPLPITTFPTKTVNGSVFLSNSDTTL